MGAKSPIFQCRFANAKLFVAMFGACNKIV